MTSGSNKISLAAISDDPATIIQTVYPQDLSPSSRTMGGNLVQSPSQAGPVFVSSDQNIDCALNGIASPLKCEHSSVLYASLTNFAEEVAVIKKPNQ